MLIYLGVDFDEVKYAIGDAPDFDRSAWTSKQDSLNLAFPSLPYFIDDGVRLTDAKAIIKFICCKYGPELNGEGASEVSHVEMIASTLIDLQK